MTMMGRPRHYQTNAERQAAYRVRRQQEHLRQIPQIHADGYSVYQGDALAVLPLLGPVDAVVTDPPYGVNLGVDNNPTHDATHLGKKGYATYADTYENFCRTIVPALNRALDLARLGAVFSGPHLHEQRKPTTMGGVYLPQALGRTPWGSKNFLPLLLYGRPPGAGQHRPTMRAGSAKAEDVAHPCAKPLAWMTWVVELASRVGEVVLDPFMGSGTTGVACLERGRRFVGIEVDPGYFEIACARLAQSAAHGQLFAQTPRAMQPPLLVTPRTRRTA